MRLLLVFLAACTAFPGIGDPRHYDEAASLGTLVTHGAAARAEIFSGALQADGLCLALAEAAGLDEELAMQPAALHVYRVDPATAAATELPPLALAGAPRISQTASGCAVAATDGLAYTAGDAWTLIPPPPATASQVVILDGTHAAAATDTQLYLWDGGSWHAVAGRGGIGPVTAAGARLAFSDGTRALTNVYSWSGTPTGTEVAFSEGQPIGSVWVIPNGAPDHFQAAVRDAQQRPIEMVVYASGTWTAGEPPNGVSAFAPPFAGDTLLGVSDFDGSQLPQVTPIRAGREGAPLTREALVNKTTCTCIAATDPSCGCLVHPLVVLPLFSPDATHLALISESDLNSERSYYLRVESLPFTGVFP